jgi:hypothetical protein
LSFSKEREKHSAKNRLINEICDVEKDNALVVMSRIQMTILFNCMRGPTSLLLWWRGLFILWSSVLDLLLWNKQFIKHKIERKKMIDSQMNTKKGIE